MNSKDDAGPKIRHNETIDSRLAPGTVLFGEYEILNVLGGGGMGWVYQARHRSLGSLRAIKVIRPDLSVDPRMEEMFVHEAEALIKTHHDAVVRCHDLLRDERHRIYLVMELVEGPSLVEYLENGPMPADKVRVLRSRLASGLAAAHARGVIHRDISPSNIILPQGKPELAKLIDFGVAKIESIAGQKGQSVFKGKFEYASPEQCGLFGGKIDARSDLYSLGLVLAEAAIGAPLPMGQSFYEAVEMRKVLPRIPPTVPEDLADEILPLLEPNPTDRPASAEELIDWKPRKPTKRGQEQEIQQTDEEEQDTIWLTKVLYSATAVGIGIGLGFVFWCWKTAPVT